MMRCRRELVNGGICVHTRGRGGFGYDGRMAANDR